MDALFVLTLLALYGLIAHLIGRYAERKGQSYGFFLFLAIFTTPLIATAIAVASEDRVTQQQIKERVIAQNESSPGPTRVEQLRGLADLRDSGALTDAEFDAEKSRILAGGG